MEQEIERAVACCYEPTVSATLRAEVRPLRMMKAIPRGSPRRSRQAFAYLEQVKASADGWRFCLQLFCRADPNGGRPEAKFFTLQVVEEVIRFRCALARAYVWVPMLTTSPMAGFTSCPCPSASGCVAPSCHGCKQKP